MLITTARRARVLAAACTVAGVTTMAAVSSSTPAARAASAHTAGVVGSPLTLATGQSFEVLGHPFDVGTNRGGTAYIGWISSTTADPERTVHLCTLPPTATACEGGIQTIASPGTSSAAGLRVLVDGDDTVHLVWFHDTAQSINGPNDAAISEATAVHGLDLGAAQDIVTNAPSFGTLLEAKIGPNGDLWTVAYAGVPTKEVRVWHGGADPEPVTTPYGVGYAQLAFAGGTPVLAIEKDGAISTPPSYATRSGAGTWSAFHQIAHTWAAGSNTALATTRRGLRMVTSTDHASYRPVIAAWTGSGFSTPKLTPDTNGCSVKTHDGWSDPSGRLLDASWECSRLTVTNYPDARHAAIVRFGGGGTPGHAPQIASGTRGIATVVWGVSQADGETLRVARVRLPDSTVTVGRTGTGGRVTVTGPVTCLPPVDVPIRRTHRPAKGWRLESSTLRLDGRRVSAPLDGAKLAPGKRYALVGTATFAKHGRRATVTATLRFRTCAKT
jgi:hypothetical protein